MKGVVTEREPGSLIAKPIAGAIVQILDVTVLDGPGRIKQAVSDEQGRYSMDVPLGHNAPWMLQPPPGYVPVNANYVHEPFTTSIESPVVVKNYEVIRGAPVRVRLRDPAGNPAGNRRWFSFMQSGSEGYFGCELKADGSGIVTVRKLSGLFELACSQTPRIPQVTAPASVEFEEGFNLDEVIEPTSTAASGVCIVKDSSGKSASFIGCEPVVENKKLTIALDCLDSSKTPMRRIKGRIVNETGEGIKDARVDIRVMNREETKAVILEITKTDEQGYFSLSSPVGEGHMATLVVNRTGYVPQDFYKQKIADTGAKDADLGQFKLDKGASMRVRVVGKDGSPLPGAVVAPRTGMAMMANLKRTDEKGECELTDLPVGTVTVDVAWGEIYESCKLVLKPQGNDLLVLKAASLYPKAASGPATAPASPPSRKNPPLKTGQQAPDWIVAEWTDEKFRKLEEYRGSIVFLEFTGVWCSACQNSIPAFKELKAKYEPKGVVFIAIHSAGTDMTVVKRSLEHHSWNILTGIDGGDDIQSGLTANAYHIIGYPTVMLIGRDGKIAFTTDVVPEETEKHMKRTEELAKSLFLPWPPDKGLDKEADVEKYNAELQVRLNKLAVAMMSEKIDAVLMESVE
jgi:thiol-disulfide isomerase/thioredoxin